MLTILTLKILLMIVYLSHWDWNLYKSRKDIVSSIGVENFIAICPEGDFSDSLKNVYSKTLNWDLNRKKLFDIKGISNLKNHISKMDKNTIIHSFTLKTGILFSIANLFLNNNLYGVLSINGLGYLFSNNLKAAILRILLKPFISKLFNKSFKKIIFQNGSDKARFLNFVSFKGDVSLIKGSGINTKNFKIKENYSSKKLKVIFVSRLIKDKGIYEYIELVNNCSNKSIEFFLAGEVDKGNPNSINESELNDIKNKSNLKYIGLIDVENELHDYDISIVMSKYEGFSRILLESLYVGLFCISNDIPGTSYLNEFSNGCLVKDNNINKFNEIINNFSDYDFSELNAKKNRKLIENTISTQIISKKYNEIYDNLKSIKQ